MFLPRCNTITRYSSRQYSTPAGGDISGLKARLRQILPAKQTEVANIRQTLGEKVLDKVSVNQAYGGMRSVKSMIYETSLLDPEEGIRFRGYTIPECLKLLPKKSEGDHMPLVEGLLWLLITGEIPTQAQALALAEELHVRAKVPSHVVKIVDNFPKEMHPMTQFSASILALQTESLFAKAYADGIHKKLYWESIYEDALNAIATIPIVAARIYRNNFHNGSNIIGLDKSLDYGANYAKMLGFTQDGVYDAMRMYLIIHSDHEGGNVSAHTTHLVGSALSDPYLSLSAGMSGLAGPLHGRASQEVMEFLALIDKDLKGNFTADTVKKWVENHLASGKVVPGYGHAVLRKTDPRYTCQREYALNYLEKDKFIKLTGLLYEVVPDVLLKAGKAKNPWPNVDAHSGVIWNHFGLSEAEYYTILFGVSRAFGVLSQLVWSRILGFPLERPKSVTTEWIKNHNFNHH